MTKINAIKAEKNETSNINFKQSFFKSLLISGGYNYLAQGLSFVSSILIARLLSPENYGLVGLITVFTGFISVFSDSGISLAIIKSDYGNTYHKSLDTLCLLMGISLFLVTSLLSFPIAYFYNNNALFLPTIAMASTFLFRSLSMVRGALLTKRLAFGYLGKVVLINTVITIILTLIFAYIGMQHWSIILPQIVASVITVIMYEKKVGLKFNYYSARHIKVAFKCTRSIIGSLMGFNLLNYWSRNSDNLIVGKLYGVVDLGIYNRAYSLLTFPLTLITGLMGTVLYPSLKKLKAEGGDVNSEYIYVLKILSLIVFPISCILLLCPDLLVSLLWGTKWSKAATFLPYFGLLLFSQPLLSTIGNFLVLQGKEKTLMYSGLVTSSFIILAIIVGSLYSMMAIVQLYALCFILLVLPYNIYFVYYRALKFEPALLFRFWFPIISISLGIWVSCFLNLPSLKHILILLLLASLLLTSIKELKGIFHMSTNLIRKMVCQFV
jgi:O-antigen/teichoic acid export membrane protein